MRKNTLVGLVLLFASAAATTSAQQESVDEPETMPVALACIGRETVAERDQCTAEALTMHVVQNLDYPKKARRKDISGLVVAQFVVDASGEIRNAEILRSPDPMLNAPAIAAIESMPVMKPGQMQGKDVAVRYVLPIKFVLHD